MQLKTDPGFYIYLAILTFLLPLKWLIAWFAAVCLHELFHFVALKMNGGKLLSFSVCIGGANMVCADLTEKKYLVSVLAGPLGGLALLLLGRWIPRVAICSFLLSVYNLIPLLPLDGGQALHILMKNNERFECFQKIMLLLMWVFSIYLCFFRHLGLLPVLIVLSLFVKNRTIDERP